MCLFVITMYLPYRLARGVHYDASVALKRYKNNKKLKKRRDICPVNYEKLQVGQKYKFRYFDNTVSPYHVFEGGCLFRAKQGWIECVDKSTVFYKKRILGWSLVKCAVKFLGLHSRAVVTANHPLRKLARGEFKEDDEVLESTTTQRIYSY